MSSPKRALQVVATKERAPYGSSSTKRSQRKADTMRRLLEAGCSLFSEYGYEPTTIDQITTRAGVSRAAFYLHFETKSDIIRALVVSVASRLRGCYAHLTELGPTPSLDDVIGWTREFLETCRSDGATVLLLQRTLQPDSKLFDEIAFYEDVIAMLGQRYPRFAAAATDPTAFAEALLFFFQLQALIRQLCGPSESRLDWDAISRAVANGFLRFLEGGSDRA